MDGNRKLRGKIIEVFGSCGAFAEAMGMTPNTLSFKLSRKFPWKKPQMEKACKLLGLKFPEDVKDYFD